jgi:hypothetical protein
VYQLRTGEEESSRSGNFAGLEGDFAGGARELRGPQENDESPAGTRLESPTSRVRGNAYKGAGEPEETKNSVVAVAAKNGKVK